MGVAQRRGWAPADLGRVTAVVAAAVLVAAVGACVSQPQATDPTIMPSPSRSATPIATVTPTTTVTPAPGDHRLALSWQGRQRWYELHAPPGYRAGGRVPLVVVLHHQGGSAARMRELTRFDAKADKEGFLVAYPEDIVDDVGFVRAVVEQITQTWGVDPDRVYATGLSSGADLVMRLAVEAPGVFAAVAPVAGGFIGRRAADDPSYRPIRPVSVVSFADNSASTAIAAGLRDWQRKLGCAEREPESADLPRTVTRVAASCADGSEVVSYGINKMGRSWPGSTPAGVGEPEAKVNATYVMWAFFAAHPRLP